MRKTLVPFAFGFLLLCPTLWAQNCPSKSAQTGPFDVADPAVAKVDVPRLIHLKSEADVARIRKELIHFIWKNGGTLPTAAEVVTRNGTLPKALYGVDASCVTLRVSMLKGFSSLVRYVRPGRSTNRLAMFHHGHSNDVWSSGGAETVRFFLDRGFDVLVFQMPLMGDNRSLAPPGFRSHNDMAKLASPDFDPIRLFLEPVTTCLNHVLKTTSPREIVMIGLSGGGWTTTLYAAIDPRVKKSIPVAGSLPDYLRTMARDIGDWEQSYPDFYRIANYLDLYILGSSGEGRIQRQILNQYDSCCFAGVGYRTYEKHVQGAVGLTGRGEFGVFLDDTHRDHLISRHALEKAVGPLID